DAGADAVFVEAPESADEMAAIRIAVPASVPLVANMVEEGKTPLRPPPELAAAGFQIVTLPLGGLLAAAHALADAYAVMRRDGTTGALAGRRFRFDQMNALLGLDDFYRREREWLERT